MTEQQAFLERRAYVEKLQARNDRLGIAGLILLATNVVWIVAYVLCVFRH